MDIERTQRQGQKALLVIDVQKALFERPKPIHHAEQLLENINQLIREARNTGTPVIFVQHENEKMLVRDSDGWQLHPQIRPLEAEPIIHKRQGNAFEETPLEEVLKKRDVNELVITGLVTQGCVKATCLGALEKGYRVILVSDAHSNYSADAADVIVRWHDTLKKKGAELLKTREVGF